MSWIDFREISNNVGGFSSLFHDYVYDFEKVREFYNGDFRSAEDFQGIMGATKARLRDRHRLANVLRRQNQSYGCGDKALDNIDLLKDDATFAVVTGQQVGILGGPMYTLYKVISAIKLSNELTRRHPPCRFVPVFWLEGEDHDFAEVNAITVITRENLAQRIEYLIDGKLPDKNIGAVGSVTFDGSLASFFEKLDETLVNTEFKPHLLSLLQTHYVPGVSFANAFVGLLNAFFHEFGLVFINSNDKEVKEMLVPVFQREVREFPKIGQEVIDRSAELEERYHAQVKPKAVNLFLFHKGGRFLIEPRKREGDFALKGTRHTLTKDELDSLVTTSPELLSPNVVLRPICQDYLLPTVAYVGGPSEIAYFAQLGPVYSYYDVTMPIIYPRASVTLFEEKLENVLEKYNLQLVDFFRDDEDVGQKVIDQLSEVDVGSVFVSASKDIANMLSQLNFALNQIDQTLLGPLESTRSKVEESLNLLKEKTLEAQRKKHEIAMRQVLKVTNHVCPNATLQERELNVAYFLNKYGLEFVQWLTGEILVDKFRHQVVRL